MILRYERLRSFHAELSDPALAARVERELRLLQPLDRQFLRPLQLPWASMMTAKRLTSAFMLAANIGLCRAFWLTACGNCFQRNLQARILMPLNMCWACARPYPNALYPEPELVFTYLHAELSDGCLPHEWDTTKSFIRTLRVDIAPKSAGLLPSPVWAYRLVFQQFASTSPFTRSLAVLPDIKGPEKIRLCPKTYPQGGVVISTHGQFLIRNPFPNDLLRTELLPGEAAARIGPENVLDCEEYEHLFS